MRERRLDRFRRRGAHDDRATGFVRLVEALGVGHILEHERVVELELAFDGDLGNPPPGGAEPALSHRVTDSPGAIACTSTPGACCRSSSGVPARSGKVP